MTDLAPYDPTLAGVTARAVAGGAEIAWSLTGGAADCHRAAVAIDGRLAALVPAGDLRVTVGELAAGAHSVAVALVPVDATPPDMRGIVPGTRLGVSWPAAGEAGVLYRVHLDGTAVADTERTLWVSDELAAGTYAVTVSALDEAGNESAVLTTSARVLAQVPDATNAAATWDGTEFALSFDIAGTVDSVAIFSNYSTIFGRLVDDVIESAPWQTLAGAARATSGEPPVAGLWRFIVRPILGGRTAQGCEVVEVDTLQAVNLTVPAALTATPVAGGCVLLRWCYRVDTGAGVEGFNIYTADAEAGPFVLLGASVAAPVGGNDVQFFTYTTSALAAPAWLAVTATGATGESPLSVPVLATPDALAPVFTGAVVAVAT